MLSSPVQQNSKWFFVFQVETQLKLIFLWKFAVQHERSVTTLRRRSRDLAMDMAWRKAAAERSSEMHIWLSGGCKNMNFQKPKHWLFRWNILYSCFMKRPSVGDRWQAIEYVKNIISNVSCVFLSFRKSCLTGTTLSKLIPLNHYNFLLKWEREP